MESKILFEEEQSFWQNKIALLVFGVLLVLSILAIMKGISLTQSLYLSAIVSFVILIFWGMLLRTEITQKSIKFGYKYVPFANNELFWSEVQKIELQKYSFVGWGLRYSSSKGTIYNVAGNKGLQITLKTGKKYLLGTQKSDDLKKILEELLPFF